MERLQKVLAHAGVASRRESEKLIQSGRVSVNGKKVTTLGVKVSSKDKIEVDHTPIYKEEPVYYLFNKPDKVITSVNDEKNRPVVLDYFDQISERIYPVGRLDYHTTGVLILTNDGKLANALMHPRKKIEKTYLAKVEGVPTEEQLEQLRQGIKLDGKRTAKAKVQCQKTKKPTQNATLEITIHEGRNRQIRRMCEAIGHPVKRLRRERYAYLTVGALKPGEYRRLSKKEVSKLYNMAGF